MTKQKRKNNNNNESKNEKLLFIIFMLLTMFSYFITFVYGVEVEQVQPPEQQSAISSPINMIKGIASFIIQNWGYILFGIILIILGVVIYYLIVKYEEAQKERDDIAYEEFKNTERDCEMQCDKKKIRKTWNPAGLLWFLFPPLFWLCFFMKVEHSAKLINSYNEIMGYYRGHCYRQDKSLNYLIYKEKFLFFFEKKFIIKCPLELDLKTDFKDPATGAKKVEHKFVSFKDTIRQLPNGDIKVRCASVERIGWYRIPVYVDEKDRIVDIRQYVTDGIVDSSYNLMIKRVLSSGSNMVEKAMQHNPYLLYNQKSPVKTKAEETQENT